MSKKCTPFWREAHFQVKMYKKHLSVGPRNILGPLLEVDMSKKCTPLWREAHFQVKMLKAPHVQTTFGRSDVVLHGRRKGFCTLPKLSKLRRFCNTSMRFQKKDGRRGTFEEDLQRCISHGRRNTRDVLTRDVRKSGS